MALIKYNANPPPGVASRTWLYAELRKIEQANSAIIDVLEALDGKPIVVGANDSGGVGQRLLTIPNA